MFVPVDRSSRKPKEKRIRQRLSHLASKIAFLCTVRFVHQDDNIVPVIKLPLHLSEFEDCRNENLALLRLEKLLQLLPAACPGYILHLGAQEIRRDLLLQVYTIINYNNSRRLESGLVTKLLGGKQDKVRFARSLEMPNQALLDLALDAAFYDGIRPLVLLIATHDLDQTGISLVRTIEREISIDVKNHFGRDHRDKAMLHIVEGSLASHAIRKPRPPLVERSGKSAIAKLLSIGRNIEDVRHECMRDTLLVIENITRTARPGYGKPHGSLCFTEHHRKAVNEECDIKTLRTGFRLTPCLVHPLSNSNTGIVLWIVEIKKIDRRRQILRSAWKGVKCKKPLAKPLVCLDQVCRIHQPQEYPLDLTHYLISLRLSKALILIEQKQASLQQPCLKRKSHILAFIEKLPIHKCPAVKPCRFKQHRLDCIRFVKDIHLQSPYLPLLPLSGLSPSRSRLTSRSKSETIFCVLLNWSYSIPALLSAAWRLTRP